MKQGPPPSRSGRFSSGPAQDLTEFTQSVSYDWRLWRQDIRGSIAHARMLRRIKVLSVAEEKAIIAGLNEIAASIESGAFVWRPELEDVHMNLEAELTRRTPAGAKLHTGRSRNDQVALDMRLWLIDEVRDLLTDLGQFQSALVDLGSRHHRVVIPGYTHLQRAQPVYLAHHLLAYVEMIERDRARFEDAAERARVCPLGCGAIAGSTLPLDRAFVARELGFVDRRGRPRLAQNSMDAVSDRDFIIEFCAAAALLAVHLSRLSEDLILWATVEFGFVRLSDAYTTGSSLMPQKRNPDAAELGRGKAGRVLGNLVALLTLVKGLPMTYNRDLQEDKERLFDTADTVRTTTRILAAMLRQAEFRREVCDQAARDPVLLATDLADHLVSRGMAFREAHHVVGRVVAAAEAAGKPLNQLTAAELESIHPEFDVSALEIFDLPAAMDRRRLVGSPGTREVRRQLAIWRRRLQLTAPAEGPSASG